MLVVNGTLRNEAHMPRYEVVTCRTYQGEELMVLIRGCHSSMVTKSVATNVNNKNRRSRPRTTSSLSHSSSLLQ